MRHPDSTPHSDRYRRGFTIVELLIVIVVIGILAAITIVAYGGLQNRAKASAAQAAASQAAKKLLAYAVTNNDAYPADLATAGISNSGDTSFQYSVNNSASPKTFCVTATTQNSSYWTSSTSSAPTAGGCPGHGVGGVAAVTNLAINPSAAVSANSYSGWSGSGGTSTGSVRVSAAYAARGWAVRNTWTAANTSAYNGDVGFVITAVPGNLLQQNTQYTAAWKVVSSKAQRIAPLAGNWRVLNGADNSGSGALSASSGATLISAGVVTNQFITFTTGANTVGLKLFSSLVSGTGASFWGAGDYLEMSDLVVVQGSVVPNYADGDTPGWIWNGTPNSSTSTGPPQ